MKTHRLFQVTVIGGKRAVMVCMEPMTLEQATAYAHGQFGKERVVGVRT